MPKRKSPHPERPWTPDPVKWQKHLEKTVVKPSLTTPVEPKGGWMLYRWDDLTDVKQTT